MIYVLLSCEALLAPFAAAAVVIFFLCSRRRSLLGSLAQELPERLGVVCEEARLKLMGRTVWWFHAASAGEVGGLEPVFDELWRLPDPPAVLVTTMTVSGRAAARRNPKVAWAQLAPLDAWPILALFCRAANPTRIILSETELWPSLVVIAESKGLRPALINARISSRSFPRYRAFAALLKPVLSRFSLILAQTDRDAERYIALGAAADKVKVCGNTKFDRVLTAVDNPEADRALVRLRWTDRSLFVAGSTHPGEERALVEAFALSRREQPNLRLIIAPRHLERAGETQALLDEFRLAAALWSRLDRSSPSADVLLIDAMGILKSFWPKARVAFVGGTLVPVGGHNLLEPAAAGVPVLFGPYTAHVEDAAEQLVRHGGGRRVESAADLSKHLLDFAANAALARKDGLKAQTASRALAGATSRVLAFLGKC